MNLPNLVARNARKYPQQEAVICQGRRVTYQALDELVNRLANALLTRGVKQQEKVLIFMPNTLEFVVSYFAIQRIGAIVVPVNAKFTAHELQHVITDAEASTLIVHEALWEQAKSCDCQRKIVIGPAQATAESFETLLAEASTTAVVCTKDEEVLSTLLYTSGTTGKPKGVLFSARNILTVAYMMATEMSFKPESRVLLMMPLTHSAPLHLFLVTAVYVGATCVLTPTFTPQLLLQTVESEKTTHFFGAPVAYLLAAQLPQIATADLSSMEWWVYGGAPVSKSQVVFIQQAFRTTRLTAVYGLTEAGPSGSLLFAEEHEDKAGSIGKRAPLNTELRIITNEGRDVAVGEVGEIILYGEGNMVGYYNNPEATKAAMLDGWVRSGDLAMFDNDGYIWIVDRKKDVIISGGVNIYPKEIEDCITQFDNIIEVAVIGVPHPQWGETVKAVFAAKERIAVDELQAYLEQHLATYKVPKLYEQVEALPRNASGKILKQTIKEVYQ